MNILIILPNWIGDVVMSLPVLEKCREIFPDSNIKILIRKDIYPLIKYNCVKLKISPILYNKKNFYLNIKLIKFFRKKRFDIAFILPRSYRMFLISLFSNIKQIYGYGDFFKNFFLTNSVKRDKNSLNKHRVYYYLDILKLYKNVKGEVKPTLLINNENKIWADNFLNKNKIKNKILIGINPGATYGEAKCWNKDNFLKLLKKITDFNNNCFFLIFGGKDNIKYNISFNKINNCLNLTGKLSIDKTAALIEKCKLFITNDTGPMHIADALNIDIIAIFGPTNPDETPPFTKREHLLYKKIECSPCKKRICPKKSNECMENIKVDDVFKIISKKL